MSGKIIILSQVEIKFYWILANNWPSLYRSEGWLLTSMPVYLHKEHSTESVLFSPDGQLSNYQLHPTGLYFSAQTETCPNRCKLYLLDTWKSHSWHKVPMYNSAVYRAKNWSKKITLDLCMGQKVRLKKVQRKLAYLKENSKMKDRFFKKILTQK